LSFGVAETGVRETAGKPRGSRQTTTSPTNIMIGDVVDFDNGAAHYLRRRRTADGPWSKGSIMTMLEPVWTSAAWASDEQSDRDSGHFASQELEFPVLLQPHAPLAQRTSQPSECGCWKNH
jgi:hypothetical protein